MRLFLSLVCTFSFIVALSHGKTPLKPIDSGIVESSTQTSEAISRSVHFTLPEMDVQLADEYRCVTQQVSRAGTIKTLVPRPSDFGKVHHMTLHLCKNKPGVPARVGVIFNCHDYSDLIYSQCVIAAGYDGMAMILQSRAHPGEPRNKLEEESLRASMVSLPTSYGIKIGPETQFQYSVLEVHNNAPMLNDTSGFELQLTDMPLDEIRQAGLACGSQPIPGGRSRYIVGCDYSWNKQNGKVHLIHYHFHLTGTDIMFQVVHKDGSTTDKQFDAARDSQTMNLQTPLAIESGDTIKLRCAYNTTAREAPTKFGPKATDEMCNAFFFFSLDGQQDFEGVDLKFPLEIEFARDETDTDLDVSLAAALGDGK